MRRWSDFPEDNRDRAVRRWLSNALHKGLSDLRTFGAGVPRLGRSTGGGRR